MSFIAVHRGKTHFLFFFCVHLCHNLNMKIILSFVVVIASAFLTHHFFISKLGDSQNRDLASFAERNSAHQIQWEHQVAGELAQNKANVQVAVRPNWQDQLAYEFFMGQYDISLSSGQIQKITLQKSMRGVPLSTDQFIKKYGHQLKEFSSYKRQQVNTQTEMVDLFDKTGQSAGRFQIIRNDEGRVVELAIQ